MSLAVCRLDLSSISSPRWAGSASSAEADALCGLRFLQRLELIRHVDARRTSQLAVMRGIVESGAPMHGREVVPDDEIAGAPFVAVDEVRLRRLRHEVPDQQSAFGDRPLHHLESMRSDVD